MFGSTSSNSRSDLGEEAGDGGLEEGEHVGHLQPAITLYHYPLHLLIIISTLLSFSSSLPSNTPH